MILELKGDIRETPIKTIAHGVNCQGVMGSGVAKALYEKWPAVREEYLKFHRPNPLAGLEEPKDFLGKNNEVYIMKDIMVGSFGHTFSKKQIINMHTQLEFGSGDRQYIDYAALMMCFGNLPDIEALAVPKIGAGLAGGDWSTIKRIMVEQTQKRCIDLVIYSLTDY